MATAWKSTRASTTGSRLRGARSLTAGPWKQFLGTLSAIYPLPLQVPWLTGRLVDGVLVPGSFWMATFLRAALIVALTI